MNWPLVAGGLLSMAGALIHGIVGDRIVRRLDTGALPGNPFGDAGSTKFLIRVSWHFVTIVFVVLGVTLVLVGSKPQLPASIGVAYVGATTISCWAVFGLIAAFVRGGIRSWAHHPAPLLLSLASILIWLGSSWL